MIQDSPTETLERETAPLDAMSIHQRRAITVADGEGRWHMDSIGLVCHHCGEPGDVVGLCGPGTGMSARIYLCGECLTEALTKLFDARVEHGAWRFCRGGKCDCR